MKIDMHCHTREGSIDAKVDILSYARKLKKEGFGGMLVSDHNSYDGYRTWRDAKEEKKDLRDFHVFKGIEYDTRNGGHILVILPEGMKSKLVEIRGMAVERLIEVVHSLGGILGPAHPYGTGYFAIMHTNIIKKQEELLDKFDFVEIFNSGSSPTSNRDARKLAKTLKKPGIGGSDAHKSMMIGTAGTLFTREIRDNDDLIAAIRDNAIEEARNFKEILRAKSNLILKELGIAGYWVYNKAGALVHTHARHREYRNQ